MRGGLPSAPATRNFADPDFDGDPARLTEEELTAVTPSGRIAEESPDYEHSDLRDAGVFVDPTSEERRKFYFDEGRVEIAAHLVVSETTVKTHVSSSLRKLGATSRAEGNG